MANKPIFILTVLHPDSDLIEYIGVFSTPELAQKYVERRETLREAWEYNDDHGRAKHPVWFAHDISSYFWYIQHDEIDRKWN